jgi:transcription termination factor NusB
MVSLGANCAMPAIQKAARLTAGTRRKSRELAMQMLFQADIGKQTPDQVRATFWKAGDEVEPEVRGFAEDLFRVAVAGRNRSTS